MIRISDISNSANFPLSVTQIDFPISGIRLVCTARCRDLRRCISNYTALNGNCRVGFEAFTSGSLHLTFMTFYHFQYLVRSFCHRFYQSARKKLKWTYIKCYDSTGLCRQTQRCRWPVHHHTVSPEARVGGVIIVQKYTAPCIGDVIIV